MCFSDALGFHIVGKYYYGNIKNGNNDHLNEFIMQCIRKVFEYNITPVNEV